MPNFTSTTSDQGFHLKLWRGERMCLLGFDVDQPELDLVGFAIERRAPGEAAFAALPNRLAFAYPQAAIATVTGARRYPSTEAPFQKFRWIDFPHDPVAGDWVYRATKMHMRPDGTLVKGTALEAAISLDPVTYHELVDVGFTRNFASSQAFADRLRTAGLDVATAGHRLIPKLADDGLTFAKMPGDIYDWLGFEARGLLFGFLEEAANDPTIQLDVFAYDFNEPDLLALLQRIGPRLRVIIDDSTNKDANTGVVSGHGAPESPESQVAVHLAASAGAANVKRTHFTTLQHNKVFVASRGGVPFKVLAGSTNFTFRGLYIQANNVLVFSEPTVARLFSDAFNAAFADPQAFKHSPLASTWHAVHAGPGTDFRFCFSPHKESDLSLNPVRGAIDGAASSVLYAVAFLNLIKSGPTKEALDRLANRPIFSYGVSDKAGGLEVHKPDGSVGLVDFAALAANAPPPFAAEWRGGKGINIHHKFVVTDFNLPTAMVFTGSSNLAPSGETGNGDHLICIQDQRIATAYAIEALRMFDHLHFRTRMSDAKAAAAATPGIAAAALTLRKPRAMTGKAAWFEAAYVAGSQKARDRGLFSG